MRQGGERRGNAFFKSAGVGCALASMPVLAFVRVPPASKFVLFSLAMLCAVIVTAFIAHATRLKAWQKFVVVLLTLLVAIPLGSIPPGWLHWYFRTPLWSFIVVFAPAVIFGSVATWVVSRSNERSRELERFPESDDAT